MKLFFKTILKFGVFATCFYIVGVIISGLCLPHKFIKNLAFNLGGYGHTHTRLKEVNEIDSIDILFLGSSHAYRGFDTRIFNQHGYTCFNLGSSSQTPLQTIYLLEEHLHHLHPKTVIYEVNPEMLAIDGVESSIDIISNTNLTISDFELALKTNNIKTYNTYLYAIFRQSLGLDKDFSEPIEKGNDLYIKNGGYVENRVFDFHSKKEVAINYETREKQIIAFKEVIQKMESINCKLILIQAPVTKEVYGSYTNIHSTDSLFRSHGKYYNFNDFELALTDSLHFYDSDHLNQKGVELFNKKIIELLH